VKDFKPSTDLFGWYAVIDTDHCCSWHIYKVVGCLESNSYCDVPIQCNSTPTTHGDMAVILNVIHCGIDETKVVRVALKDCELVHPMKIGGKQECPICSGGPCNE